MLYLFLYEKLYIVGFYEKVFTESRKLYFTKIGVVKTCGPKRFAETRYVVSE